MLLKCCSFFQSHCKKREYLLLINIIQNHIKKTIYLSIAFSFTISNVLKTKN